MKTTKKLLLCLLCVGVICGIVACGRSNVDENKNNDTTNQGTMNDRNDKGDNLVDDVGDAVKDGVQGATDGVNELIDGVENADYNNNVNDATDGTRNGHNTTP